MILNDSEIIDINQNAEFDSAIGYARKIEAAVLEKLKVQEPEAYKFSAPGITKLDSWPHGGKWYPLYRYQIPPADVVRDAERYRWLVDNSYDRDGFLQFQVWKHSWEPHSQTGIPIEWKCRVRGPAIDAAIDAAMGKMK